MGFSRKFSCFIWTTNDCRRIPYEHYLTPLVIFHVWREFFREISNHSKLTLALHWDIVVNCFADELTNLCRVTASTCTACLSKTLIILHEGTTFLEIWGHVDWLFFFFLKWYGHCLIRTHADITSVGEVRDDIYYSSCANNTHLHDFSYSVISDWTLQKNKEYCNTDV